MRSENLDYFCHDCGNRVSASYESEAYRSGICENCMQNRKEVEAKLKLEKFRKNKTLEERVEALENILVFIGGLWYEI